MSFDNAEEVPEESARVDPVTPETDHADGEVVSERQQRPAVGIVATATNGDAVARTVLRAHRRGHEVLVAYPGGEHLESAEFARELGSHLVELDGSNGRGDVTDVLSTVSRSYGYPGLIYNGTADEPIDYDETVSTLDADSRYDVEAVTLVANDDGSTDRVLVGVPAFNEAGTIADVVESASEYADGVLVVDDGSDDDTPTRAEEAGAMVIRHKRNQGYGAALKTLFEEANRRDVEHLIVIDADGQHDAADIPRLVDVRTDTGADIVIGSRFADGGVTDAPLYRKFGLSVINTLTNVSLGGFAGDTHVSDTQSGFRAYSARAVESLAEDDSIGDMMSASTDILYHANQLGYDIREVGTRISYDVENGSTQDPISHGLGLLNNILNRLSRDRPLTVLGIPGLLMTLIGIPVGVWTVESYTVSGSFSIILAMLAGLLLLLGTYTCLYALVSHVIDVKLDERNLG